jgi:K+-transporting ATPase ATPase C chain
MDTQIRPAITTVLLLTVLLGAGVPAIMNGIAGAVFPRQAGGSLIERDGKVVGSALIGQAFAEPRYFHPRPSSAGDGYDAGASAASQLGPTSEKLLAAVKERVAAAGPAPVPADAVTGSGSGLDPDISLANAQRQVARVAAARGLPEAQVQAVLAQQEEGPQLGFLGERRVNVLRLNLALDALR